MVREGEHMVNESEGTAEVGKLYKQLRNNILLSDGIRNKKAILITSTNKGEGKTKIALNLAFTMANSGKKTLLINCNMNNDQIPKLLRLPEQNEHLFIFDNYRKQDTLINKTSNDKLDLLTFCNLSDDYAVEIEFCTELERLLDQYREQYDFILIDSPAVTEASFVQTICQYLDGSILVVQASKTLVKDVVKTKEILIKSSSCIIGVVLNKADNVTIGKKVKKKKNVKESQIIVQQQPIV